MRNDAKVTKNTGYNEFATIQITSPCLICYRKGDETIKFEATEGQTIDLPISEAMDVVCTGRARVIRVPDTKPPHQALRVNY